MRSRLKLTYANVMVTVLAFIVLAGGGAYAASQLGKNSVGTKQLQKSSVTSAKVENSALRAKDLKKGVIPPTANGYQASGSVNYDTFSSSLYGSNVVTLDVPPGSYLATTSAELQSVNSTASGISCRLINGVGGPGSSAAMGEGEARADNFVDNMTLTGLFEVADGQALNLECSKDNPAASARIVSANIVAVRIGKVTGSP